MMQRIGITLIFVSIFLFICSFAFIQKYNPIIGFVESMNRMEIVLSDGKYIISRDLVELLNKDQKGENLTLPKNTTILPSTKNKSMEELLEEAHWEGRISFPYKWFFVVDMALLFAGLYLFLRPRIPLKRT
jgi:hypothetical protein